MGSCHRTNSSIVIMSTVLLISCCGHLCWGSLPLVGAPISSRNNRLAEFNVIRIRSRRFILIIKFDDWQGLQHSSSKTFRPTLSRSSQRISGAVSFGSSVSTNSSNHNDNKEQCGNDTGDAE